MSDVDPAQLDQVLGWYQAQIKRRGTWTIAALALFSFAILSATFVGVDSNPEPENPAISASWTGAGDKATVQATVEVEKLLDAAEAKTTISGITSNSERTRLFRATTRPDADGELKLEAEVGETAAYDRVEVKSTLTAEGHRSHSQLTLSR